MVGELASEAARGAGHGLGCVLGSLLALWGVGGKHLIAVLQEEELRPRTQASLG